MPQLIQSVDKAYSGTLSRRNFRRLKQNLPQKSGDFRQLYIGDFRRLIIKATLGDIQVPE